VRGIYSHVTEPMQQRIAHVLQQRWQATVHPPAEPGTDNGDAAVA
jgi:hypothetical protein